MKKIFSSLAIIIGLGACSSNDNPTNIDPGNTPSSNNSVLKLQLKGIEPMDGQHYEGWLITEGEALTSGRFNVDSDGMVYSVNKAGDKMAIIGTKDSAPFSISNNLLNASAFILTIEPNNDTDDGPSSVHYVGGSFENKKATAAIDHSAAIGTLFKESTGSYILATPSNGPSTHNQGIWFLDNGNPSLNLPDLNDGWVYEGWIVNTATGDVVSTGTFSNATGADSDGPGATAGPNPTPAFPGQDFINPAMVLNDGHVKTVISIEPETDFDPKPFTLKILAADIPLDAAVTTGFGLTNISNGEQISIEATLE